MFFGGGKARRRPPLFGATLARRRRYPLYALAAVVLLFILDYWMRNAILVQNESSGNESDASAVGRWTSESIQSQQQNSAGQGKLVFVLGMHHSMTSVATKLLVDTGRFYAGEKTGLLIRWDNPLKYWELAAAVRLNQKMFNGGRWKNTPRARFLYEWLGYGFSVSESKQDLDTFQAAATRIVGDLLDRTGSNQVTLIKDPRLSLTLPVWLSAAKETNTRVACAILIRDPLESVYRFLADYNSKKSFLTLEQWASVWEQYTWMSIKACMDSHAEIVLTRHEDFALNPTGSAAALAETLLEKLGVADRHFDPSLLSVPSDWSAKHQKKTAIWNQVTPHLRSPKDIFSPQAFGLWVNVQQWAYDNIFELVSTSPPPKWISLDYEHWKAYVVRITPEIAQELASNLLVLHRSLSAVDTSRRFVYLTQQGESKALKHILVLNGWERIDCDAGSEPKQCLGNVGIDDFVELSPNTLVIDLDASGHLVTEECPGGACENANLYQAYMSIGGRTSEA